jgi:hypothetical protein
MIKIAPVELLRRFKAIHGAARKRIDSYLRVTKTKRCREARGLPNTDQELIALDRFMGENRDNEKGAAGELRPMAEPAPVIPREAGCRLAKATSCRPSEDASGRIKGAASDGSYRISTTSI